LSLQHPNNRLENIAILFALLALASQKNILMKKNIGGAFAPPRAHLHPQSCAYDNGCTLVQEAE
jgi:hypothetical protein